MARPSKYDPETFPGIARAACIRGVITYGGLGKLLGRVTKQTVHTWREQHPELNQAIIEGTDVFRGIVAEDALAKRVAGYNYTEVVHGLRPCKEKTEDGEEVETEKLVIVKKTLRHVPADVGAIQFSLKNRDRKRWAEKLEVGISSDLSEMTTDDLVAKLAGALAFPAIVESLTKYGINIDFDPSEAK